MTAASRVFDWNDLAFASKKPLNELAATFIAAPRELSAARFTQLVKTYLPKGNIILGLAKEPYVLRLENQPQFRMLATDTVQPIVDKVNANAKHTITILNYFQRDLPFILEKLGITRAVFINASWYFSFHLRKEYYVLAKRHLPYQLVSPFTDEAEAQDFARTHQPAPPKLVVQNLYSDSAMMALAKEAAKQSFDYSSYQTGGALGRKQGTGYRAVTTSFNRIVPYQTYSWHHGASREREFSPMNDINFYDTNHYEIELLLAAQATGLDLAGTSLFCNVMHCPPCARMIASTPIAEIVYARDHGGDYAVKLLEASGKTVRRLV